VEIDQVNVLSNALINSTEKKNVMLRSQKILTLLRIQFESANQKKKKQIKFWPLPELQGT